MHADEMGVVVVGVINIFKKAVPTNYLPPVIVIKRHVWKASIIYGKLLHPWPGF